MASLHVMDCTLDGIWEREKVAGGARPGAATSTLAMGQGVGCTAIQKMEKQAKMKEWRGGVGERERKRRGVMKVGGLAKVGVEVG